jgi:hypothetical protein
VCAHSEADQLKLENHQSYISGVIKDGQAEYGKQILTLAAGILALSVTFYEDVHGKNGPICKPLLYGGWICLLVAITSVLFSIQSSIAAHKKYLKELQATLRGEPVQPKISWQEKAIPHLNLASTITFGVALLLLVAFAAENLRRS